MKAWQKGNGNEHQIYHTRFSPSTPDHHIDGFIKRIAGFSEINDSSMRCFVDELIRMVADDSSSVTIETSTIYCDKYGHVTPYARIRTTEYDLLQHFFQNSKRICPEFGLSFEVKEQDLKYDRSTRFPYLRTGNFQLRYVITIGNINVQFLGNEIKDRETKNQKLEIDQYRKLGQDYYDKFLCSDVVSKIVDTLYVHIKYQLTPDLLKTDFSVTKAGVYANDLYRELGDAEIYLFQDHNLAPLESEEHIYGLSFAIVDLLERKLQAEPSGFVSVHPRHATRFYINNTFDIRFANLLQREDHCLRFYLSFSIPTESKPLKKWH